MTAQDDNVYITASGEDGGKGVKKKTFLTRPIPIKWRWPFLLGITFIIQCYCTFLAPQYIAACPGPHYTTFAITLIPLFWAVILLAIYKGWTERVMAWGGFTIALTVVFVMLRWVL